MIKKILMGCAVMVFSAGAQEHGKFAVQANIDLLKYSDVLNNINSSVPNFGPSANIGVRFFVTERFGFDVLTGILYSGEANGDSVSGSNSIPEIFRYNLTGGMVFEAFKGEKACLSFIGDFSLLFSKQYYSSYSTINTSSAKYNYYSTVTPTIFLGLEPSFLASKNFALFCNFGLAISFIPSSQSTGSSTYNPTTGTYTYQLKSDNNGHTSISTNGLGLGMRYYF